MIFRPREVLFDPPPKPAVGGCYDTFSTNERGETRDPLGRKFGVFDDIGRGLFPAPHGEKAKLGDGVHLAHEVDDTADSRSSGSHITDISSSVV